MAVSEMKRLTVICPTGEVDDTVKHLMWLSCVDIRQSDETDGFEKIAEVDGKIAESNKLISRINAAIDLLSFYDSKKWEPYKDPARPRKRLFAPPENVDMDEFMNAGRYDIAMRKLNKITSLSNQLSAKREEYASLRSELASLSPWRDTYHLPLGLKETAHTDINIGVMGPKIKMNDVLSSIDSDRRAHIELVSSDEHASYVCAVTFKEDTESVMRSLYAKGFTPVSFDPTLSYAEDEAKKVEQSIVRVEKEISSVEEKIAFMVGTEIQLEILHDIVSTELVRLNAEKKALKSGPICIINGWIPDSCVPKAQKTLDKTVCAYEFSEPSENDDVPVLLENNKFASCFEPVVSLYSLPKYKTFDPTFIMSIFYVIIFGFMFADVGYGLILSLGCFAAIKLLYPKGTMKKFFQMFGICGISCIFAGILTGGYFGDLPGSLFGATGKIALWFDPITDPMTFLILSLAIGAVHLITGMVLKMIILIKQKKVFSAIFDVGSWLVLFAGLGLLAINTKIGMAVALSGVLMLVLTQGRHEKNILMKFFKGLLSLYDITSYASDLLSYSRILALGLASAVIAKVVNLMAAMVGTNVVGYLLMIIILIFGHLLNMAINVLGTFVHTSRLQYIEFFGKFYDEGGTPFEVLSPESKYVTLTNKEKS